MDHRSRLVAYVRVSTEDQASGGVSLDAQRSAIEAWALAGGHEIVSWCSDAASGKDTNRPEFQHALNLVWEGAADGLVTTKVDRFSRSVIDFATLMGEFQKRGKSLVCIADQIDMTTPTGRFFASLLANLAQLERELIGERTRVALAEKRRQGVRLGRPPSEAVSDAVAADVRRLHAEGQSQRAIASVFGLKVSTVRRLVA